LDSPPGYRIAAMHLRALSVVTEPAGQPQILFSICSASRFGNEVVDFKHLHRVALRRQAVARAVTGCRADTCSEIIGDFPRGHGSSGGSRPRRTASASAWDWRKRPIS